MSAERAPSGAGHDTAAKLPCACHGDDPEPYCPRHTPLPGEPADPPVSVPGPADPVVSPADTRHVLVIRFRERENAEKAREQIVWAMERAQLVPFHIEIEEIDRGF